MRREETQGRNHHSTEIAGRKGQHLEICLDSDQYEVQSGSTRLDEVHLVHRALPEVHENDVSPRIDFLGYGCRLPVFISSMTGGSSEGYRTNKDLATVAGELGIAVGMGSIRILLRKPEVIDDFHLKKFAPQVPVFANIGGVQLPHTPHDELFRLVDTLRVDAIAVHLNPGQELFQPGGDRDFRGVIEAIGRFVEHCPVPVIVKETGFGINPAETKILREIGTAYVDVAGSGGTNWVRVEAHRQDAAQAAAAFEFDSWGLPTALLLAAIGRDERGILASGGIRTGIDVVRCLALGAEAAGMALPFIRVLRAGGIEAAVEFGCRLEYVIRAAMTMAGCTTVEQLRSAPMWMNQELAHDAAALRQATGTPQAGDSITEGRG
jgi:isopentenyl-diphosphate Delta-isomerase